MGGQAEAGQWIGSSALARGPWSQDRQPRRTAGEERIGMLLRAWANLERLRIVVTVRRGGAPNERSGLMMAAGEIHGSKDGGTRGRDY